MKFGWKGFLQKRKKEINKNPRLSCWRQMSFCSTSMQIKGETAQLSMFNVTLLRTRYILQRDPASNLGGFLQALRTLTIYSYLWNKFCLLKAPREQVIQQLHISPEGHLSSPGTSGPGCLSAEVLYTECCWSPSWGPHKAFPPVISSALC